MRLSYLPAALLALIWAGAADACCFFKCKKSSNQYTAVVVVPSKEVVFLKIVSVGGQTPNSNNEIPNLVSPPTAEIVVQRSPGSFQYQLFVQKIESGRVVTTTAIEMTRTLKKDPIYLVLHLATLEARSNYRVWAAGGLVKSNEVTFTTGDAP